MRTTLVQAAQRQSQASLEPSATGSRLGSNTSDAHDESDSDDTYSDPARSELWASDTDSSPPDSPRSGPIDPSATDSLHHAQSSPLDATNPITWMAYLRLFQYWKRDPTPLDPAPFHLHDPHTLALSLLQRPTIDHLPGSPLVLKPVLVTETELIRETLFLLRDLPTSFFETVPATSGHPHDQIRVIGRIAVTHLAQDTLLRLLRTFTTRAVRLRRLRRVVHRCVSRANEDPVITAFGHAVDQHLRTYDVHLSKLEAAHQHQYQRGTPRTASLLHLDRATQSSILDFVADFVDAHEVAVLGPLLSSAPGFPPASAREVGTRLVDAVAAHLVPLALSPLFAPWLGVVLATIRGYAAHIDRWLSEGQCASAYFFIHATTAAAAGDDWNATHVAVDPPALLAPHATALLLAGKTVHLAQRASKRRRATCAIGFFEVVARHLYAEICDPGQISLAQFLNCDPLPADAVRLAATPIAVLLEDAVAAGVRAGVRATRQIVASFARDHAVRAHVAALSAVMLMEDGAAWTRFADTVFRRMRARKDDWRAQEVVETVLDEVLDAMRLPVPKHRFVVRVDEEVEGIEGIKIEYEAPWPLQIVVAPDHIQKYNQVFAALLTLRRAKYMLEAGQHVRLRRVRNKAFDPWFGLQFRLLLAVRAVEGFWLLTVIDTERRRFQSRIDDAESIDQLVTAHTEFLDRILEQSLLRLPPLAKAIFSLFDLCLEFTAIVDHLVATQFIDRDTTATEVTVRPELQAKIKTVGEQFESTHAFLVHSLEILTTKGNVQHLESLLYALSRPLDG
ncbi:hypothetical protein AMAG_13453 [Allomyces macrogynus ATCC 38327]|uniref:Spindle pole body component n=1 Tax=Allomyces macrogynus (strain ATCC 38327) TaxID=578462 RepID=A0A0L0T1T9_ALLM3|nr:hypothetical protein AMAG_13453 [Allomyces macrogynus ATCC 38327]|eukprot:KNE68813.1 hypothetical protein AMAG_13453 [Allomyces macrogynus ATCC 38327]